MNRYLLTSALCLSTVVAIAQEQPASNIPTVKLGENVNVKFGGFARADYFVDTRKGTEGIDGLLYLWPDPVLKDADGSDLNKKANQNLSATPTRFTALFGGPEAFKAKASAYFEFDFTGGNSSYLLFRQGWLKLEWAKSSLLVGRTWHPIQGPVTPSTIPLNYGTPFNVFCRGEQVRFTYKVGTFNFLAATFWQAAHASFGPDAADKPAQSLRYMRNSMIPDLNFQIHFTKDNFTTGILTEYKVIQPREYTTANNLKYKTDEKVSSYAVAAFGQYKKGNFIIKGNAMYGQNMAEGFMQGGYACKSVDPVTGRETYSVSSALTSWLNIVYGDKVKFGLFGGYQKNLGFMDNLDATVYKFYGRADNINSMYRVSPSISFYSGRMAFQIEDEITTAQYGTVDLTDKGRVKDTDAVTNNRITLSVSYFF
jgi:hypothetical protein